MTLVVVERGDEPPTPAGCRRVGCSKPAAVVVDGFLYCGGHALVFLGLPRST